MYKYSIVIPVYNAEKYIKECIDSLISQKKDIEVLLVDDGSADNSGAICDEYANTFDYIKVFHIENGGPGNARNIGAQYASGDFLLFMDSDDYISEGFFDKFEKSAVDFEADVIFFESIKFFSDGREEFMAQGIKKSELYKKSREEVYSHIAGCSKFPASPWGKIINLEFYKAQKISMPSKLLNEDIYWSLELVMKAKKFDFFEEGFYYYRQIGNSRSSFGRKKSAEDSLYIIEQWVELIKESEYKESFYSFLAYQYAMIFPFVGALEKDERRAFSKKMKEYKYLLNFGKTKKLKLIKYAVKLLGVNRASVILYRYVTERDKVK